jgi:hypothetical protein
MITAYDDQVVLLELLLLRGEARMDGTCRWVNSGYPPFLAFSRLKDKMVEINDLSGYLNYSLVSRHNKRGNLNHHPKKRQVLGSITFH